MCTFETSYPLLAEMALKVYNRCILFCGLLNLVCPCGSLTVDEAIDAHKTAAKLNPLMHKPKIIGAVYEAIARYEEAFVASLKLSLDPDYATAVYNLGAVKLQAKILLKDGNSRGSLAKGQTMVEAIYPDVTTALGWVQRDPLYMG